MKRTIFVASLLALGVTAAIAQSNVVEQRQDLMKQLGAQTRPIGGMLRGQEPFDLAQAQAGLKVFAENAKKLPSALSGKHQERGEDRGPADDLGEQGRVRVALATRLSQDAQTAMTTIKDEASFKAEMPKVLAELRHLPQDFRKRPPDRRC